LLEYPHGFLASSKQLRTLFNKGVTPLRVVAMDAYLYIVARSLPRTWCESYEPKKYESVKRAELEFERRFNALVHTMASFRRGLSLEGT